MDWRLVGVKMFEPSLVSYSRIKLFRLRPGRLAPFKSHFLRRGYSLSLRDWREAAWPSTQALGDQ